MGQRYPAKYRVILWAVLLSPFLYLLAVPPVVHLGEAATRRWRAPAWLRAHPQLARIYYEGPGVISRALRTGAIPYWLLAENAPLQLEMAFFEYDTWWRHNCE